MAAPHHAPELESWILDLEDSSTIVYVLDQELRIVFCNRAWDEFALQNGGAHLVRSVIRGQSVLPAISAPFREFYATVLHQVQRSRAPFELEYECSSPDLYRVFQMRILPARDSPHLLVTNTLAVERPHGLERPAVPADASCFVSADGAIHLCGHCRRTRRNDTNIWEWAPSYLNHAPARVSHGICPLCLAYFYPDQWQRLRHRLKLK